jgi:transcriptional regulator with XRE-family HTH domain
MYIQRVCRQKGLSIRDVQERAGGQKRIAASYISRIYNGKVTNLSVEKLMILAEGLDVDPFELFAAASGRRSGDAGGGPDALELLDTMQLAVANPDAMEIVQTWLRLPAEHQTSALNWVRFLSQGENSSSQKASKMRQKKR